MAKQLHVRRFDARYGISVSALEAEATALAREVEDYQVESSRDLKTREERVYEKSKSSWEHLHLLLKNLPAR